MDSRRIRDQAVQFSKLTVKHLLQEEAKATIKFKLDFSPNVALIALVGPTGVGKTTLLERLRDSIHDDHSADMASDPGFIPLIWTTAMAADDRRFEWSGLYREALVALGDPFVDSGLALSASELPSFLIQGETQNATYLRRKLKAEVTARRTRVWVIDEADHVVQGGRLSDPLFNMQVLKSVAQTTGLKIVLCGTYSLLEFLDQQAQLSRRTDVVHFSRYGTSDQHKEQFGSALESILMRTGMPFPPVKDNYRLYYIGSAGCVGIAKDWVARSHAHALFRGEKSMSIEHLQAERLGPDALEQVWADIQAGESRWQVDPKDVIQRIEASLSAKPVPLVPSPSPTRRGNRRPGARKLGRDRVGAQP